MVHSNSSSTTSVAANLCRVCNGNKPDNANVSFCSACKKFFLRNRSKIDSIKCATGQKNCYISANNRRLCSYCRLMKCFAIGIRGRGRIRLTEVNKVRKRSSEDGSFTLSETRDDSNEETTSETSTTLEARTSTTNSEAQYSVAVVRSPSPDSVPEAALEKPPILFDGSLAEMSLRTVIKSATELSKMDQTPMRYPGLQIPDMMALWGLVMKQLNFGRSIGLSYSSCWMDVGDNIDIDDYNMLIFQSLVPMGSTYMALPGNKGASMYGIHDCYASYMLQMFPDFTDGAKGLAKLNSVIDEWNPSFVETAFLLAYLFYNDKAVPLRQPEKVARVRNRIVMIYRMYVQAHAKTKDYAEFATSRFVRACKVITDISEFMFNNIAAFAKKNPQLALVDDLFARVFAADLLTNNQHYGMSPNQHSSDGSYYHDDDKPASV